MAGELSLFLCSVLYYRSLPFPERSQAFSEKVGLYAQVVGCSTVMVFWPKSACYISISGRARSLSTAQAPRSELLPR
jgi:hypothetical protein